LTTTNEPTSFSRKLTAENFEKWLGQRVFRVEIVWLFLAISIIIYTATFSYFTILKHYEFRTYAWDLGIFNQSFWTTIHYGRFFYSNVELLVNPSGSFFGAHFSPILLLILPFYAIDSSPQSLLVIQSFVLALAIIPLYKLTFWVSKYRFVGLFFCAIFLLYPPLQGMNWFDFHLQSFLPLFFFSTIYFLERQKWAPYLIFITLALMVEEHAALTVFFVGLLVAVQHRKHILSVLKTKKFKDTILLVTVVTLVFSAIWYLMTIWVRDAFFPVNPAFLSNFKASSNWSVLGVPDPVMIPFYIVRYPDRAFLALSYDSLLKTQYLAALFFPLAFTSFLKTKYLLPAVPWFVYSLFSNFYYYYIIYDQYPAYAVAFILVAAVYAVADHSSLSLRGLERRLTIIFLCTVIAFAFVSPLSPYAVFVSGGGVTPINQHEKLVHEVLAWIPANASIMTHNNLFPHVSSRINAYVVPSPVYADKKPESRNFTRKILGEVDYALVDIEADAYSSGVIFSLLRERDDFKVQVSGDGVMLFKKGFTGNETILAPYQGRYDHHSLILYSGELVPTAESSSDLVLHFNGSLGDSPMFWYGPRTLLPPGKYDVTLRLQVKGSNDLFTVNLCSDNGQSTIASETYSSTSPMTMAVWLNWKLQIVVNKPLLDFEVRAVNVSRNADIYLDYIQVETNP